MPVQARTSGVLMKWHVREGQRVQKGDPIVDLADNDPEILQRMAMLRERVAAASEGDGEG